MARTPALEAPADQHYWRSAARGPAIPHRGHQMFQALAPSPIAGIAIDRSVAKGDNFRRRRWLAPA